MKIVFDIETNGLQPTKVWCIVAKDIDNGTQYKFVDSAVNDFSKYLRTNDVVEVIGHNIIGFDVPVLEKLVGVDFSGIKITDTLVMSRLFNPSREGGHSLEAWGEKLRFPKGKFDDWSQFSYEMLEYCTQDVEVNARVYSLLQKEAVGFSSEAIDLEHRVQTIITQQQENGWLIDEPKAHILYATLQERRVELEDEVHKTFKPVPVFDKEIKVKYKKDGGMSAVGLRWLEDWQDIISGDLCRITWQDFNLGSRKQIATRLQKLGWKPKKFTSKGNIIVDEVELKKVKGIPECDMIAEYFLVQKREAMLKNIIEHIKDDGRVHGYVNSCGAVTGRMTHSDPNLAQIPASYSPYGKEFRGIFTVPEGYKLVGCDASGLELRMLAHYMDDEEYTNEVLHGDIHTANQLAAGLQSRDQAKTFIYAFLYGAGDSKIGSIIKGSSRDGKRIKSKFLSNTPSLGALRERVTKASKRGYLKGLDGRKIWIRSEHSALNALLQGAGAIVMKKALTLLDEYATIAGLDYKFVGNIHDEFQTEVREDQAEEFGSLAVKSIVDAGISLDLRCPLDGDYQVDNDWSGTH